MVAVAPSIVPRQVTRLEGTSEFPLAARSKGTTARPAAAALMRMKRRREIARVIVSSSIGCSAPRCAAVRSRARFLVTRSQYVVARHVREDDNAPAFFRREFLRGAAVGEGDGFVAA